jgi:3-deoxy-D-manno-octulosonate 8-phosphate phosphatase (KDO 8-P phosphatase)
MAEIKLIVLDVDGCLSDGKIFYSNTQEEIKAFDVKDGLGIASWIRLGKDVAIITGRKSNIVQKRADELGIRFCKQGIKNKKEALEEILKELDISWENVAAIGDDYNDFLMLKSVGISFSPANGVDGIKEIVDFVLSKEGGKGAVREMIDYLIKKDGLFEEFLKLWSAK